MLNNTCLYIDYETRSCADLRRCGLDVYAAHPSTEIVCAAYAFDDGEVHLWKPLEGELPPPQFVNHIKNGGMVSAWNAPFEMVITNVVGARDWSLPTISPKQATCTMARAYAMGLPGSLDGAAAALGMDQRKDLDGGKVMLQLSKPRSSAADGTPIWWDDAEKFEILYKYCRQDVVVERAAGKRMPHLSPYEQRVWALDYEINRRGVKADVPTVRKAITLVEHEKARLDAEMQKVSNGNVTTCTAVAQIKNYLEFYGVSGESLDKATVLEHLTATNIHPNARRILELRAEAGKAATSKFTPMVNRSGADGRVRGGYQYSGANTRRWAARGLQLHNMKRPTIKHTMVESIINDIADDTSAQMLSLLYGPPMDFLGDLTRSFLLAEEGHELIVADFNAIEARVLAWLAGEEEVLNVFRDGKDIYKQAASKIFGVTAANVTDDQRQVGKVAVLALGYGGGVGAFQTMAKAYNVKMAPAYGYLNQTATPDQRIRADKTWESNHKNPKYEDISREEFIASELTKLFWRNANPNIVNYWEQLEQAAIRAALNPGTFHTPNSKLPSVKFKKSGSFLWCQLPGSGVICYPYPEVKEVKTPWGANKTALTYMAEDGQSHKWMRFTTYGGSMAENITQAVSRDLLADAMLRLDARGFKINLHTHDEACCEMPIGKATLAEMIEIMVANPDWAKDLPIKAAGFVSKRYRK